MTKKVKSLNQDQLYELMWSNDWEIVEQTQALLNLLVSKAFNRNAYDKNIETIQALIDKKYNIIGAQMILDEVEK
jgi:hypothetical protein